jgi:hypothetical protein
VSTQPNDSAKKPSSNTFNRQIGLYSLAAATAGVSLLALAQPAAGEVAVTRKTIQIPVTTSDMPHPVRISMANNGVDNFSFSLISFPANGNTYPLRDLILYGASSNANPVIGCCSLHAYASPLQRGASIGPSSGTVGFGPYGNIERTYAGQAVRRLRGYWGGDLKDRYVGVRFLIGGQTHYGWIRLTVMTSTDPKGPAMSAKITGYAYETVANKPIKAGTAATAASTAEKSTAEVQAPKNIPNQSGPSLGMLAAGADGMPMWRREETSTSN